MCGFELIGGACCQEDSSLTRSNQYLLQLLERAGLVVKYNVLQRSFPKELFKARPGHAETWLECFCLLCGAALAWLSKWPDMPATYG